jgi:hypothetical protein
MTTVRYWTWFHEQNIGYRMLLLVRLRLFWHLCQSLELNPYQSVWQYYELTYPVSLSVSRFTISECNATDCLAVYIPLCCGFILSAIPSLHIPSVPSTTFTNISSLNRMHELLSVMWGFQLNAGILHILHSRYVAGISRVFVSLIIHTAVIFVCNSEFALR